MKGDFTRIGFNPRKHFSRVLYQQGRVALDADANEASAIALHQLRQLTRDLFGAAGGPPDSGFTLSLDASANPAVLWIGPGHYYVNGILCECEDWTDYAHQPDCTPAPPAGNAGGDALLAWLAQPSPKQAFWVYLDVWEQHVSWLEDDSIRERALGGPDTCTRAKVVWQVRALPWDNKNWGKPTADGACTAPLPAPSAPDRGRMAARLDPGAPIKDPCIVAPDAAYRGAENQLYRIEIHRGSDAAPGGRGATFKWSRDNGSVATRWLGTGSSGDAVTLIAASSRGFAAGDWVEISHDALELAGQPGQLVRIAAIAGDQFTIDPASVAGEPMAWSQALLHPRLRRWDQRGSERVALDEGAVPIPEAGGASLAWTSLEDGLQVAFEAGGTYRSGDYWLVPARVASGIDWPAQGAADALQPPQGIVHHYAPLGVLGFEDDEGLKIIHPCRNCFQPAGVACSVAARPVPVPE